MSKYDLGSLLKELEKKESKSGGGEFSSDSWKPTIEKGEEKVEYIIRFLPNPDSKTNFPWVERPAHMFNFPSGKFIYEPCPKKSKNEKCYICEEVDGLYKSGDPSKEKIGGKRFAKQRFFHNILVINDPRDDGKNEGKIFIYECGQKVFGKCVQMLKCEELEPEERVYFHPTAGTNFKLVITWQKDYPNYDDSYFLRKTSPLDINGNKLSLEEAEEYIQKNCLGLNKKLLSDSVFKPYEKLKDLYLNQGVVEEEVTTKRKSSSDGEEVEETIDETINEQKIQARNPEKKQKVQIEKEVKSRKKDDEDDEDNEELDEILEDSDETDEDSDLEDLLAD